MSQTTPKNVLISSVPSLWTARIAARAYSLNARSGPTSAIAKAALSTASLGYPPMQDGQNMNV